MIEWKIRLKEGFYSSNRLGVSILTERTPLKYFPVSRLYGQSDMPHIHTDTRARTQTHEIGTVLKTSQSVEQNRVK